MADPLPPSNYASRGGLKLEAALRAFDLHPTGWTCADLGCSTGGFVDCLLQHGAARVYAVDTAYGELAWKLRQDPRVTVLERSNALHLPPPENAACDLVTVDLGWTRQRLAVPAALRWLRHRDPARPGPFVVTLIKPHYETDQSARGPARSRGTKAKHGVLTDDEADATTQAVLDSLPALGVEVVGCIPSPIPGGKGGNREHLALLRPLG